ncbi:MULTISPECIES: Npun_R2821/Npun_R2822 family protein [Cyanophyceae]|uniref:Npun_R2821/Npun_R2822 family protein n=1 Tax=Cyanophyceae TaxID=3028117 RepID=UPI001683E433|nr:Npun_R2821/Npun_R2822 family protein [Trichocoleus sp. FACHB-69]MBD1934720.1 sugar transferase [Trichocoleus sp. FACHB-69]
MNGICTLGNDKVYDQLVALLNSIEVISGLETPVCVYPFDDQTERIASEIANRPNVFIYDDRESIERWDQFMLNAAPDRLNPNKRLYGAHRRFCGFDGPFEKFVYMDADTLLMNSLNPIFKQLERVDWVVYDFQFLDATKVYNIKSPKLFQVFEKKRVDSEIFCSGFYGAKQGLFQQEQRDWLISKLREGEGEILYSGAGEQPLINYMVMRSQLSSCNLAQHLPESERTGCSATSKHFQEQDRILYDKGNRLTYIHYIGVQPKTIESVCAGENIEFPYRDLFLHYRYLHEPEKRPVFTSPGKPHDYTPPPSVLKRVLRKLKLTR